MPITPLRCTVINIKSPFNIKWLSTRLVRINKIAISRFILEKIYEKNCKHNPI